MPGDCMCVEKDQEGLITGIGLTPACILPSRPGAVNIEGFAAIPRHAAGRTLQPQNIPVKVPAILPASAMEQGTVTPVRSWVALILAGVIISLSAALPRSSEAGEGRVYKVQGTVIAITLNQTPPIIVVNTPLTPKNHMTVGATVTAQTKVLRGQKKVALQSIKVGETVWLTYVKAEGGLFARTIQAKG